MNYSFTMRKIMCGLIDFIKKTLYFIRFMRKNIKKPLETEERARQGKRKMWNITIDGHIDEWWWQNISMSQQYEL